MWQAQKGACFLGNIGKFGEAPRQPDQVEQITVLAGRGILPLPCRAFGRVIEPDEKGAPRCVVRIANQPVIAVFPAGIEVTAAHRLSLATETMGQIACIHPRHQAASRSDYVAQSAWTLYDASGTAVASGGSSEAASFNYADAAFADVTAQSAAQERVAILLARTLRQDLIQQVGRTSTTAGQ